MRDQSKISEEADCDGRNELTGLLAAAYLRLLRAQSAKSRLDVQIQPPDSPQLSGYELPPE